MRFGFIILNTKYTNIQIYNILFIKYCRFRFRFRDYVLQIKIVLKPILIYILMYRYSSISLSYK